ncbi:hypothetical protein PV326_004574, partial [Microctonus aethiopoides]
MAYEGAHWYIYETIVTSEQQEQVHNYDSVPPTSLNIQNDLNGLHHPDILSPYGQINAHEQGDMTVGGRILITSKRPVAESLPLRKPIKGCYCNHESKKIHFQSTKIAHKPNWPCDYCRNNFDICLPSSRNNDEYNSSPALSCKTLQKVQKINYTPRSEFLRRVQEKVSHNYNICRGVYSESVVPSSHSNYNVCCNDSISNKFPEVDFQSCVKRNDVINHLKEKKSKSLKFSPSSSDFIKRSDKCLSGIRTGISDTCDNAKGYDVRNLEDLLLTEQNSAQTPEIQTIFPLCKRSKFKKSLRRTINSATRSNDVVSCNEITSKPSLKVKKKSHILSQKNSSCTDCCTVKKKSKNSKVTRKKSSLSNCTKCCGCLSRLCPALIPHDDFIEKEAAELRAFREKNYFDTHGSRQTLLSSTESLEQFEVNDRLFPESIGKINHNDLVVSMPICATKQLKRIHYFPRYIVKQQKNPPVCHSDKNGRYKSCPLIGHAIDLGVLKNSLPVNSLALKFQKLEFGLMLTFIVLASTSELPSDFKICRRSDPNLAACFNEAGQKATIFLANGLKSLEVPPIEPLAIERMTVGETHGVVALKQDFRNIKLHGLTKGLKVTGYNIDFDKLVFKSLSFNPEISFDADYTIDGRLLLLPIRGNGKANITMYNMKSTNTYYGEKFEKNGEIYMKIKKFLVKLSPEKIHLHF